MTQSFAQFILPAAAIFVAEFMECRSVIHDGKVRQLVVYDVIYQFFGIKQHQLVFRIGVKFPKSVPCFS